MYKDTVERIQRRGERVKRETEEGRAEKWTEKSVWKKKKEEGGGRKYETTKEKKKKKGRKEKEVVLVVVV